MSKPEQEILDAPAKVAEYSAVDAGLAELRDKVANTVYDITTTAGDKTARALRLECVTLRGNVETLRQEAKKPILEKGRLLDAEAARITAEIKKIETPLDDAIKAEEKRKVDEKLAKERAEAEARRKIDQAISDISFVPVYAAGKTADEIDALRVELRGRELPEEEFGARIGEAGLAKAAALTKLDAMHAAAVAQEAEAARLAAERADLERQRQELADQRAQQRQDAVGGTLDAGTKTMLAPLPESSPPADDYEAAEREHFGDPHAGTGIYAPRAQEVDDSVPFPVAHSAPIEDLGNLLDADEPPAIEDMIEVIAEHYDVAPFTAEAWLRAAFGAQQ